MKIAEAINFLNFSIMHSINIHDLKNYSTKLIAEFLSQQPDNEFEIIIPRDQIDPEDINYSIFWQYYSAAYAGQKLFNISESFAYYVPFPKKDFPFRFEITVIELKKLTLALRFIIIGYYSDDEGMLRFHEEASKYFDDSFKGKIDSNCWGLLSIANQYLGK
jgi:hypothetical protein